MRNAHGQQLISICRFLRSFVGASAGRASHSLFANSRPSRTARGTLSSVIMIPSDSLSLSESADTHSTPLHSTLLYSTLLYSTLASSCHPSPRPLSLKWMQFPRTSPEQRNDSNCYAEVQRTEASSVSHIDYIMLCIIPYLRPLSWWHTSIPLPASLANQSRSLINTLLVIAETRWSCATAARHLNMFFFFLLFNNGSELMLPLLLLPGASESVRDLFFFFTLCSAESFVRGGSQHGTAPASNAKHPWHFGLEPKKKERRRRRRKRRRRRRRTPHSF